MGLLVRVLLLEVRALAYADDLAIASSSSEDILVMMTGMEEFSSWAKFQ